MIGAAIAALSLAAVAGGGANASPSSRPAIAAKAVHDDVFPVVEARYPGGIVVWPHVEFANYVGYRPLQLDLYLHADRRRATPRPLVVWVHGGGWNRGDGRVTGAFGDFPAVLASLAARGYVVASIDYRLSGEARFPAQVQDVKAAIRYLRSKARDYGIDGSRVMLWGGSAGGHLAALAATTCGVAAFDPAASTGRLSRVEAAKAQPLPQSDCVQAAAIWYGVFDMTVRGSDIGSAIGDDKRAVALGCGEGTCATVERAASPIAYVRHDTPPMLLVHGTADGEVSFHQTEAMAGALRQSGAEVETLLLPDIGHALIGKTPTETRRASLSALDRTFAFFDRIAGRRSGR